MQLNALKTAITGLSRLYRQWVLSADSSIMDFEPLAIGYLIACGATWEEAPSVYEQHVAPLTDSWDTEIDEEVEKQSAKPTKGFSI